MFIKFKSNRIIVFKTDRIIVFKTDIVSNCIDIWKFNNLYWYLKFLFLTGGVFINYKKKFKKNLIISLFNIIKMI